MTHDRQADKSWWCDQTRTSRKLTGGIKVLKFHCVHAWTKRHSVSEVAMAAELSDHVYRHHSRHPYKCLQSTDLLFTHLITQFKKRAPKSVLHYIGIMHLTGGSFSYCTAILFTCPKHLPTQRTEVFLVCQC